MRHADGFTLLEVLAAMAVLALILAGLAEGYRYGLRAQDAQSRLILGTADLGAIDGVLRNLIEVMDAGNGVDPAPMSGTRDQMSFVTLLPDAIALPNTRRARAALLVDGAHRLVLRWQPYAHVRHGDLALPATTAELLPGVSRLELSFWRPGSGWVSSWAERTLPSMVRVRLVFPAGDARHWPDIVVSPTLDPP